MTKLKFLDRRCGAKFEDCSFIVMNTINGNLFFDAIYQNSKVKVDNTKCSYSYDDIIKMKNFRVRQEGTIVLSKYKTGNGLINAIKKN